MNSPTAQDISNVSTIAAGLLASGIMSRSFYDTEIAHSVVTHAIAIYAEINTRLAAGDTGPESKT
jgi:hypothetical protein